MRVLSIDPPVFLTGIPYEDFLGIARAFSEEFGDTPAGFIVYPTWSLERANFPESMRDAHALHRERFPNHCFRFICNTKREEELLAEVGLPALFLNKNFTVSETIFRPVDVAEVEFDAIYNARFVPVKKHNLTAKIPRVAFLAYMDGSAHSTEQFQKLWPETRARNPEHRLLNAMQDGFPRTMPASEVNTCMARAAVGLILSPVEGSSYASMEYMLAGLPVVSTPSIGGRDVYFDDAYCIVCDPDEDAVRDAVADLKSRKLPRDVVRRSALAKIEPERRRLLDLADDIREELGARRLNRQRWPFSDISGIPWGKNAAHLSNWVSLKDRAVLASDLGLGEDVMDEVQLSPDEIRPVVAAVRELPACRLLVFGCGHDSRLWDAVNRNGTTVFLEDQPKWAAMTRSALPSARVFDVSYTTKQADWAQLLESGRLQPMTLPAEVAETKWDVILVDGPAGYDDRQPGRMQSIEAASRVVAPGGVVFVHDCDRPAEAAFADHYLGKDRRFAEVAGRGLLRGYRFPPTPQ